MAQRLALCQHSLLVAFAGATSLLAHQRLPGLYMNVSELTCKDTKDCVCIVKVEP